ncbi:MAG: nitrogen regulation protein NR(II) [Pirellulales bacterium]
MNNGLLVVNLALLASLALVAWLAWRCRTSLKAAREAQRIHARAAGVLEVADDGIISIDAAQRIIFFNRAAEKLFAYRASEVLGQPLDQLLPERFVAAHRDHVSEYARSGRTSRRMSERVEVYGRRRDGVEFPIDASISRLQLADETILTVTVRDITERRRHEAALRELHEDLERRVEQRTAELRATTQQLWQAAKLASVGELSASIAHELNNPLATICLRIESALVRTPTDDPRRRALEVVQQEAKRMGELVSNLLQFSRRGDDARSTINVPEELIKATELVEHYLRRRDVRVAHEFHPQAPLISANRQKLRQVFLNLLTNAADAMPGGGELRLAVSPAKLGNDQRGVIIEVRDTGHGIDAKHLPNVFEPFFTTKEEGKGTGLGLAICRRIIQEHGGQLAIDSQPGQGTTVRLELATGLVDGQSPGG